MHDLLLVIDVGNSNTVLGLYEGDVLSMTWRIGTQPVRTTDELGVLLLQLLAARNISPDRIGAAICSCVVPPAVHAVRRAARRYFGVTVRFVGQDVGFGIPIRYDHPEEVGADRIVNAVAAYEAGQRASIVVDFGTATTFDIVGADGGYEGGVIAPGLSISLDALHQRAAQLPRVEIRKPESSIARNTVEAMQAGIVYGYVGLVDGITARIIADLEVEDAHVIATGGLAGLIAADSRYIESVHPNLTLEGLRILNGRLPGDAGDVPR